LEGTAGHAITVPTLGVPDDFARQCSPRTLGLLFPATCYALADTRNGQPERAWASSRLVWSQPSVVAGCLRRGCDPNPYRRTRQGASGVSDTRHFACFSTHGIVMKAAGGHSQHTAFIPVCIRKDYPFADGRQALPSLGSVLPIYSFGLGISHPRETQGPSLWSREPLRPLESLVAIRLRMAPKAGIEPATYRLGGKSAKD
jgi:hypothetical protein